MEVLTRYAESFHNVNINQINTIYALTTFQFYILFKTLRKFTMQYGLTVLQ